MSHAPLRLQGNSAEHTPEPAKTRPTFREVFDSELGFVWTTLRRFGVASSDLEDVAHDVFVVVHRRLDEYDHARPIRPWLLAIAVRCASDYRRRARRRRHHEVIEDDAPEGADTAGAPDERLSLIEERDLARRALHSVPEERRAVLVLFDFEEAAMDDIARELGIPVKTAYSRLRLARAEFIEAARRLRKKAGR